MQRNASDAPTSYCATEVQRLLLNRSDAVCIARLAEHERQCVNAAVAVASEERERCSVCHLRDLRPLDVVPLRSSVVDVVRDGTKRGPIRR